MKTGNGQEDGVGARLPTFIKYFSVSPSRDSVWITNIADKWEVVVRHNFWVI